MNEVTKSKRDELKAISEQYRPLVKAGELSTINSALAQHYRSMGHTGLRSYEEWQKKGYRVLKGSKALLLWAAPYHIVIENTNGQKEQKLFFPMAYVFSSSQVEIINNSKQDEINLL